MSTTESKPTTKPKFWMGSTPLNCQICNKPLITEFVDGATKHGPWAIMCYGCTTVHGRGIGLGKGQHYAHHLDNKWIKIAG